MKNIKTLVTSLLFGLLVLSMISCGEEKPEKLTAMEEARARIAKHKKKYESQKLQAQQNKSGMPEWVPNGFPYPEDTILRFHTGNLHGGMVNLTSNLPLDEINKFYLEEMPEAGWIKGSTKKREYYYLFKKIDKEAIIALSKEPGEESKTRIKITVVM
ncbi:MAG TPA: hypothetical protein ENJ60_00370 [Aeromonadales bacterium]|nr:hypothetical protein [Aeromonadales bacterium]